MTFLECINRILRSTQRIRGDTDDITSFDQTQHNSTLQTCIVAVQDEIIALTSRQLIPAERKTTGVITLVPQQMDYTLASDFIRFFAVPHFYRATDNRQIYLYPGGLERLQVEIYNYATQYGQPNWFYFAPTTTKKVGLFQVPGTAESGQLWTYDYEAEIDLEDEADTLPFHNDSESRAFCAMAARRLKYMIEDVDNKLDIEAVLDKDTGYRTHRANLLHLIRGANPPSRYIHTYA